MLALAVLSGGAAHAAALTPEQALGELLYRDPNLSLNRNQSCATCHSLESVAGAGLPPAAGFVDPENVRRGTPVSAGSVAGRNGALKAQSVGYAAFSPAFHWDAAEKHYVGGQFWNGRAATLADQAGQPLLNPAEMAMPSPHQVADPESVIYDTVPSDRIELDVCCYDKRTACAGRSPPFEI